MLKHDNTRWRFYEQKHHVDKNRIQFILESDECHCMAIMEWEQGYSRDIESIRADANLIQSAPIMLEALLAAQNGDMSQIDRAIKHATSDWAVISKYR